MANGPERIFTAALRRAVEGQKVERVELGAGLRTANRISLAAVVNYAAEPKGRGRDNALAWVEKEAGRYWGAETMTSSHCSWHLTAGDALLLLAYRAGDSGVLGAAKAHVARGLALDRPHATPDGRIVEPGARCFLVAGSSPPVAMADQREVRNRRWQAWQGAKPRLPRNLAALDWTPLWLWSFLAHEKGLVADVLTLSKSIPPPSLASPVTVWRAGQHHVSAFTEPVREHLLRLAYWAAEIGGIESYGCNSDWPKGLGSTSTYPADMPAMPSISGFTQVAEIR